VSYRVEEYVNADFYYYYNFYTSCKHAGNPLPGVWTDWPQWVVQLMAAFDTIIEQERRRGVRVFLAQLHGYRMS
jgi:hypothetical protein